ncbi:MAG: hypothetical protein MHM6MM_006393 [Cercozoa sp. M6MM]
MSFLRTVARRVRESFTGWRQGAPHFDGYDPAIGRWRYTTKLYEPVIGPRGAVIFLVGTGYTLWGLWFRNKRIDEHLENTLHLKRFYENRVGPFMEAESQILAEVEHAKAVAAVRQIMPEYADELKDFQPQKSFVRTVPKYVQEFTFHDAKDQNWKVNYLARNPDSDNLDGDWRFLPFPAIPVHFAVVGAKNLYNYVNSLLNEFEQPAEEEQTVRELPTFEGMTEEEKKATVRAYLADDSIADRLKYKSIAKLEAYVQAA